ncbi:MAG: glycosyltransferase [Aquincola tertiaricarbonis]|uniref:CgeB family protein n=1 Tax=Aquincola sp. J276 TaxID=2898432 RepID=UPI00215167D9|nr:glycosyltransferase [Aquincola sp. J276]MCR5865812.1 glycosyltransferase [Aquincola sp. J276]
MKILYLGPRSGTCLDRARAYERLGHEVQHLDLRSLLPASPWLDRAAWRFGGRWLGRLLCSALAHRLAGQRYALCHVDGGALAGPQVLRLLRSHADVLVNYNIDDPFGGRDGRRFAAYLHGLPFYDLAVVMRTANVAEAQAHGARRVLRVFMSADEVSHAPRQPTPAQQQTWRSDVLFVGTWMPERGPFLAGLLARGVPLSIRGAHWQKAPEWPLLQPHWRGGPIVGDDYALALQCARVNLGLLSVGNRDEHTTRSVEVPALGGLLCAQRTPEHAALYRDGVEALLWSDAAECARHCRQALQDEAWAARIAAAGRRRAKANGHFNETVLLRILDAVGLPAAPALADT